MLVKSSFTMGCNSGLVQSTCSFSFSMNPPSQSYTCAMLKVGGRVGLGRRNELELP
jgi:hypothetical protein